MCLRKKALNKEYIVTNISSVHAVVLLNTSTQFRRSGQISHYRMFMVKYRGNALLHTHLYVTNDYVLRVYVYACSVGK
jgi:hypothetical protein